MSDQELRKYLPKYGDRIAVTAFARSMGRKKIPSPGLVAERKI
jgi:hypothetical protein